MGRPTGYDPAFCEQAIEFLKEGFSVAAFAGEIGVARATVYNWMDEHQEFLDAVKTGQAGAVLWWEKANRGLAMGSDGNATSIIFGLKNRAADEWRDVKATELSGPGGGAIPVSEVRRVIVDPRQDDAGDTDSEGVPPAA